MMKPHNSNRIVRSLFGLLAGAMAIVASEKGLSLYAQQRLSALVDATTINQEFQGLVLDSSGAGTFILNAIEKQGVFSVKSISIRSPHRNGQTFEGEFGERLNPTHWRQKIGRMLTLFHLKTSSALINADVTVELLPKYVFLLLTSSLLLSIISMWIYHSSQTRKATEIELLTAKRVAAITRQVAHDIRSPLAALNVIEHDIDHLSDANSKLLRSAVLRIQEIANDLITNGTLSSHLNKNTTTNLNELIETIIEEKRREYRHRPDVEIKLIRNDLATACINASNFCRSISNIINNSYEAFNHGGLVEISVRNHSTVAAITVSDNGKGIPNHVLKNVTKRGFSHGKRDGTGIGLSFARQFCEESGGDLTIHSAKEKGTAVTLTLPLLTTPADNQAETYDGVLIDDDALIRAAWANSAKTHNRKILILSPKEEWEPLIQKVSKNTPIYVDRHLGEKNDGIEVAKKLAQQGFTELHLVTAYFDAKPASKPDHIRSIAGKTPPWSKKTLARAQLLCT